MGRNAEALEKLAEQAQVIANESTDAECRRALEVIALGYEWLADNARTHQDMEDASHPSSRNNQRAQ
jgi:hypothetical protein